MSIARFIAGIDHWVAMLLLAFVGTRMIYSSLRPDQETHRVDPSRGGRLLLICIATSIDAMAVGVSLALVEVRILSPVLVIAVVTLGLSIFGLLAGGFLENVSVTVWRSSAD